MSEGYEPAGRIMAVSQQEMQLLQLFRDLHPSARVNLVVILGKAAKERRDNSTTRDNHRYRA